MVAAKMVVAKIIKKYRAEINTSPENVKVRPAILLRHVDNFRVRLCERADRL